MTKTRCGWAKSPIEIEYHDTEWGVPLHDDRELFAFLVLEGAQAGLSWVTILKKRDAYRKALTASPSKRSPVIAPPGSRNCCRTPASSATV